MKVSISRDLCCGAQTCVETAPRIFSLNDEGFNALVDQDAPMAVPANREEEAREGVAACPKSALKIEENS